MTPELVPRTSAPSAARSANTKGAAASDDSGGFRDALNSKLEAANSDDPKAQDAKPAATANKPADAASAESSPWAFMAGLPVAMPSSEDASPPIEDGLAPTEGETKAMDLGSLLGSTTKPAPQAASETTAPMALPDFDAQSEAADSTAFAELLGAKTDSERQEVSPSTSEDPPFFNLSTPLADPSARMLRGQPAAALQQPVGQGAWKQELGEQMLWMTDHKLSVAELKLNPAHLGPMEVSIQYDQEGASVRFSAQNQAVREAIEAAVPKLREMFSSQQITLNDVSVTVVPPAPMTQTSQGFDFQRQSRFGQGLGRSGFGSTGEISDETLAVEPSRALSLPGSVNLYA